MLHVCEISKYYGKTAAIERISFEVKLGEVVGLVGHNGCGKSTTMNIITGYLSADSGNVIIDGEDTEKQAISVRRKIGYLPELPPLYPDLTVEEQLEFAAELKGYSKKTDVLELACQKAGIQGVRKRLIGNLSKGYRQRVGLAQAFLGNPPILLLDEPSSGLDPTQMVEMREMIREARKEHAILMSSHILSEVEAVCDRLVILSNGHLVASGTPDELKQQFAPENRYQMRIQGEKEAVIAFIEENNWFYLSNEIRQEKNNIYFVEFETDRKNPAKQMTETLAQIGIVLLQFGPVLPKLEEVFFKLTKDQRYSL